MNLYEEYKLKKDEKMKEYDIAIIGAGIAGLYCCMRANPDKKVIFLKPIGRRIETVKMDVFNAEYGAMRFDPIKSLC